MTPSSGQPVYGIVRASSCRLSGGLSWATSKVLGSKLITSAASYTQKRETVTETCAPPQTSFLMRNTCRFGRPAAGDQGHRYGPQLHGSSDIGLNDGKLWECPPVYDGLRQELSQLPVLSSIHLVPLQYHMYFSDPYLMFHPPSHLFLPSVLLIFFPSKLFVLVLF